MDRKYAFILIVASLVFGLTEVSLATMVSIEPIGDVPFVPFAISQNGNVVVGETEHGACLWTRDNGIVGLGSLPGGIFSSGA